ncbi:hypothetical protein [Sinisalibacter aestuarii]|uniref:LacI family transcriptional regulator n=1 Tax=Sinisalibacter aestuarii TaxID=2949426 RepID=A0ABQ5LTY8_9RHOB|nr:hypothetical protein [Sinisalibacter aestuarii]GKY88441.1 hypothetical protein STA1M1_23100 [Sinisalibacter aestuarii]
MPISATTIRQPLNQMVSAAVSELVAAIEDNPPIRKLRLQPVVVERGTTR